MSEIKPALTPEEWGSGVVERPFYNPFWAELPDGAPGTFYTVVELWPFDFEDGRRMVALRARDDTAMVARDLDRLYPPTTSVAVEGVALHAAAALALRGQPFGFTWDDVSLLTLAAGYLSRRADREACRNLRDRIAALLPPREP